MPIWPSRLKNSHPAANVAHVRYQLRKEVCDAEFLEAESIADRDHACGRGFDEMQYSGRQQQQRLAHLREAVKHLRAAGVTDFANQIAEQIERMDENLSPDRKGTEK